MWTVRTFFRDFLRLFSAFLIALIGATGAFCAQDETSGNWVIGVLDSNMPQMQWVIRDSFHKIDPLYPEKRLVVRQLPVDAIYEAVRTQSLDFVCASPQVISVLERYYGYELLASLYQKKDTDFFSETTALVFTRNGINTWTDLRGKTVGLIEHDIPDTELLLLDELHQRKLPPEGFWKKERIPTLDKGIDGLRSGSIDALAISSCLYREAKADGFSDFHIIPRREDGNQKTLTPHSTGFFPGWAFASSIRVSRKVGEHFANALRQFDFSRTVTWDTARDYRKVHDAQEALQFKPYMKFRQKTASEFLMEHITWVIVAGCLLIGLIIHNLLTERTVRRLTVQLTQTMQKKRLAEKRFEELEHSASVSQISSIVAHELRQPLAAITNFAMGIRRRATNRTLTNDSLDFALGRILQENERASAIVDHVRNYAKKHESQPELVHLEPLVRKTIATFETVPKGLISVEVSGDPCVRIDELEMTLVVRNLIKNAVEAVALKPHGHVKVGVHEVDKAVVLTVSDNGMLETDEQLEKLSVPMQSEKSEGLGLGLSIARRIIESYDGSLTFTRNKPSGLGVTVRFPIAEG